MIKVLIVDDSKVIQESIAYILNSDPEFEIVGYASNGKEAVELTKKYRPNVITMDWQMPVSNGYEATKEIMETVPTPIVVVTGSIAANDISISFSLMEAGALAVLKKPHGIKHASYERESLELIQTLKLMSEIKLVRRVGNKNGDIASSRNQQINQESDYKLISVGASTGGPMALKNFLINLPRNIPVPILIVQHISHGFVRGFVEWLMNVTNYPIHIALDNEYVLPGHVYMAPDDMHMGISANMRIVLSSDEKENGLRPAVSYLFRSCAKNLGDKAIGVLLTGMGSDGARELKILNEMGALTYAQDEKSSVVHGMPGEAIRLGAATNVCSPDKIARSISAKIK